MRRTTPAIPSPSPVIDRRSRVLRRIFQAAILAGLISGAVASVLQAAKLTPLIAAAEVYEAAASDGEMAEGHTGGIQRAALTLLANVIIATGFGLLLSAGFALRQILDGAETDAVQGLFWGLAGFACFSLAPSLGLPPELPGTAGAGLLARQSWWIETALATAAGLGLLSFGRRLAWRVLGVAIIALPHVAGAPHPTIAESTAPPGLAAEFAAASLATAAIFWVVLGSASGWIYARLGRPA